MKNISLSIFVIFLSLTAWIPAAGADTVRLLNGRSITGLVAEEDADTVTVDAGVGTVKLRKAEILDIESSGTGEAEELQSAWAEKRLQDEAAPRPFYRSRPQWGRR